jgi:hypothetical protein
MTCSHFPWHTMLWIIGIAAFALNCWVGWRLQEPENHIMLDI